MVRRQLGVRIAKLCIESSLTPASTAQSITGRGNALKVASAAPLSLLQRRGIVMPAQEESYESESGPDFSQAALNTYIDRVGAVSVIAEDGEPIREGLFQNRDGHRFEDGRYAAFTKEISGFIPEARQFTDAVRTFAYGTDASFYRLNPKMVVKVHSEKEVARILPIAAKHQVPITFRAAGTSLSGQAITDSVLLKLSHTGKNFRSYHIPGDGSEITVQPGLIGGEVNKILAAHHKKGGHPIQYKIGPDPSSIDSCMVGGMVSNNSSGMCCGVSQNTYHTLKDMRVVFIDGTVLDTADPASRERFMETHKELVDGVVALAKEVQSDKALANLIRRKFAIKCTTGYSLNALVDFHTDDPIEMIKRVIIGSEGTFGFVSQATYNTVPEWPHKASAFVMFPDVHTACAAASVLRDETSVDAVEMFDRAALRECEQNSSRMVELVPGISDTDPTAAGLLIECRARSDKALDGRIRQVHSALANAKLPIGSKKSEEKKLQDYAFHKSAKEYNVYWDVRKGLIPIVGAARETGTSMLIEDVACPVDKLADMTVDLGDMFQRYGYKEASCFGHALEGNLHLVFSQGFRTKEEVQRFGQLMDEMCWIVATKHSGSLKGEHGTGRNVAPYVEMEWGTKAYDIMWRLKELFDPDYVLNPGVVLNKDPMAHLKFLKPSPEANPLVDRCIECGFCESNCPSKDLTLTPRQRITVWREVSRLRSYESRTPEQEARLKELMDGYTYQGEQTCAADGMCQVKCPVGINTGELIKHIRAEQLDAPSKSAGHGISKRLANNFGAVNATVPTFLNMVDLAHRIVGPKPLEYISSAINKASRNYIPEWNKYMPRGASKVNMNPPVPAQPSKGLKRQVVYAPACVTRMMGPALGDTERESVHEKLLSLFNKAGYEVIYPKNLGSSCCGMMFNSRGFKDAAAVKGSELEESLMEASQGGKLPIVMDTSPCLATLKGSLSTSALRFSLYEPIEFIKTHLKDKLEWEQVRDNVAIHVPCSSKKMGITDAFTEVASLCAKEVTPSNIPCCGMAGDRGMRYPELTGSSLQHLDLPSSCTDGYSSSRTCEMSMSNHSGIHFRGLVYLVDEATKAKPQASA